MIRLIPPYLYEADAWFRMIRELKYTKVVLIYSQQEESRMVIARFQMLTDDSDIQVRCLLFVSLLIEKKLPFFQLIRSNESKNTNTVRILLRY